TICDENVEAVDFDTPADLVGISFMTALAPRARELVAAFRRHGKIVVAGGYHPTLCPEETAAYVDAVVVGEAEELWPQLLRDAAAGHLQRCYRHRQPIDPARIPPPRRDLMRGRERYYATVNAVQTGRGCVHGCQYCSVTAFHHHTYHHRPIAAVIAELRQLPHGFIFVDDNIIADRDYAAALFRAMIPLRQTWVSQCSIKIADDPELLALARRAGCRGLFIGIETLSPANLSGVGKEFNRAESYPERIRKIRQRGIGVIAGIIVGMDADTPEVFAAMLSFLQRTRIDAVQVNIMTPLPGTPLFAAFEAAGRIASSDWSRYDFRHVVMTPAQMTTGQLQDGADWLYASFYRLDRILYRFVRALFELGPVPAWLSLKLNLTYRYDNRREGIRGHNPAGVARTRPAVAGITAPEGRRI
ncbi:MAG: radical SAM protein, partial [Victivallales bacterium]|nr:radical SAM protein [Victivallales bacterium]